MSQQDVIVSLEGSAKVGAKALLLDLAKEGGAIDLELAALASSLSPALQPLVALVAPFVKQLISQIAAKLS